MGRVSKALFASECFDPTKNFAVLFFIFYILCCAVAAPLPPRPPTTPIEQVPTWYHVKELSPVNCSRAVSRWVHQAWDITAKEAATERKGRINLLAAMDGRCPLRNPPGDMYTDQEAHKYFKSLHSGYQCGFCHKTFKTEFHLDRHFDRRHSFLRVYLPDNYYGGPVTAVVVPETNETAETDPSAYRRWGHCLESYCQIFDVCDRPPNRQSIVLYNNLSLTYSPPPPDITPWEAVDAKQRRLPEGRGSVEQLEMAAKSCNELSNLCFPVESSDPLVRRANVYFQRNVCGALASYQRYLTRREYSGSDRKYTEEAFLGSIRRPLSAIPGWQISLIVIAIVVVLFGVVAVACCFLDLQEAPVTSPKYEELRPEAYRSAFAARASPATRRRGPVGGFGTSADANLSGMTPVSSGSELTPAGAASPMGQYGYPSQQHLY